MNLGFLVGCDKYVDPKIANLDYAGLDARRFGEVLQANCDFGRECLIEFNQLGQAGVREPERARIFREISAYQARGPGAPEIDLLVFFFGGHGFHSSRDDQDYLVTVDAVAEAFEETSLRLSSVVRHLRAWRARTILLVVDACRAVTERGRDLGGGWDAIDPTALTGEGMAVFSACRLGDRSYEVDELRAGIFTHALCEALGDEGRCATIYELDTYMTRRVPELCRRLGKPAQTPSTRVEPLSIQSVPVASPRKRQEWGAIVQVGREIRRPAPGGTGASPTTTAPVPLCAIDFGTCYSSIGFFDDTSRVRLIPDTNGRVLVPSVVAFRSDLDYVVGLEAAEHRRLHPEEVVSHVKRDLGSGTTFNIHSRSLSPEQVAACILRSLARNAEDYFGRPIGKVLVAIPANFSIAQGNALAVACKLAGLDVWRMIAEPSAASILLDSIDQGTFNSYGTERDTLVAVIDLGGGTFDVSFVIVGDGVFEVLSVAGDNRLGGIDYDDAIVNAARQGFLEQIDSANNKFSAVDERRIREEAERAKIALGSRQQVSLTLAGVETTTGGLRDVEWSLSRGSFRALTKDLNDRVRTCILRARKLGEGQYGYFERGVGLVILAGQGSKVFTVRELIDELFHGTWIIDNFQETAVVHGLSTYAPVLEKKGKGDQPRRLLLDASPVGIGFKCQSFKGQRKNRYDPQRDSEAIVSGRREENTLICTLLTMGTTIPVNCIFDVRPREASGGLILELVELDNLTEAISLIGTVSVPADHLSDPFEIHLDCDENKTVVVAIKNRTTGEEMRVQATNFYTTNTYVGRPTAQLELPSIRPNIATSSSGRAGPQETEGGGE